MPASDFRFDAFSSREPVPTSLENAFDGSTAMIFDYSLAGLVSAGLLFYLTYALLRPERF
jgi:K+-transporting ATPase KdpF subunit